MTYRGKTSHTYKTSEAWPVVGKRSMSEKGETIPTSQKVKKKNTILCLCQLPQQLKKTKYEAACRIAGSIWNALGLSEERPVNDHAITFQELI